jgi:uncharacterized Fe-S radical SAM superfamily protein PflX
MTVCINCNKESHLISETLGICLECIRREFKKVSAHIKEAHQKTRQDFDLPKEPPKDPNRVSCKLCVNECKVPKDEKGYCGLRKNIDGKILGPTKNLASLSFYHDSLPTKNFALTSSYVRKRREPPILIASTLLVPGYIDSKEVFDITKFIAELDQSIPYSLLGFTPNFYMPDLPCTSRRHAQDCKKEAEKAGLININIGNIHLLGEDYTWS